VTDELNQSALQLPSEIAVSGDAQSELARRAHAEPPHPYRSPFARDAARILHARSLRFDHNLHALRIVTWFEERYPAFRGLNLTLAVREGIVKHSRDYSAVDHPELSQFFLDQFPPLEAQLIDLADEIAYLTADLDDGLDSGILAVDEVREAVPLFRSLHDNALRAWPAAIPRLTVYEALRSLLNVLVTDLINEVRLRVAALGATTLADIRNAPGRMASLSPAMEETRKTAKSFLYQQLYNSPGMEELHAHAAHVVKSLFGSIMADPSLLPKDHQAQIPSEGLARTVADYIAGMTDTFIEQLWARCGGQ